MFGLGKRRTKLGKWLDARGIKQEWLIKKSGVSKGTMTNVCSEDGYMPSGTTIQKVIKALREVDPSVKANQFWDM
ncbi:HTH cro/C1-type domain-containing protein [Paenibacillus alkaliterrae]